jgi:hypothetical protein
VPGKGSGQLPRGAHGSCGRSPIYRGRTIVVISSPETDLFRFRDRGVLSREPFGSFPLYRPMIAATPFPAEPMSLSDEELVARIRGDEAQLFELLMRRHNAQIYRAARAIVRDELEAEDVMQEAYVNAFAHLDDFEGRAKFSTWMTRIEDIFDFVKANMPPNSPGKLSDQEYWAILAFDLKANGVDLAGKKLDATSAPGVVLHP